MLARRPTTGESLVASISPTWRDYFDAIGNKARAAREVHNRVVARRIVFFDKYLVNYILSDPDSAIEHSRISTDGNLLMPTEVLGLGQFAQYAMRTAYHLLSIHRFNIAHTDDVETVYVDKSMVQSNLYYDFGLYNFSGAKLVYLPHYMKNKTKTMVGDKVILAESRTQRELINEFEDDFALLWSNCSPELVEENRVGIDPNWIDSGREKLHAHSASFFHKIYYEPLNDIFHTKMAWEPKA